MRLSSTFCAARPPPGQLHRVCWQHPFWPCCIATLLPGRRWLYVLRRSRAVTWDTLQLCAAHCALARCPGQARCSLPVNCAWLATVSLLYFALPSACSVVTSAKAQGDVLYIFGTRAGEAGIGRECCCLLCIPPKPSAWCTAAAFLQLPTFLAAAVPDARSRIPLEA